MASYWPAPGLSRNGVTTGTQQLRLVAQIYGASRLSRLVASLTLVWSWTTTTRIAIVAAGLP